VTAELKVDAASVLLLNPAYLVLVPAAWHGFRTGDIERGRLRLGQGQAGRSALERRTLSIADLTEAETSFTGSAFIEHEGFVSHYVTPLAFQGEVSGVLEVFSRSPLAGDPDWIEFFETLAQQTAIAIAHDRLQEHLRRSHLDLTLAYDATLEGWSRALDLRDHETEGHTQRVTRLTLRLARAAGMSDAEVVQARRGALLHDIGKVAVPDSILNKPGPLSSDEWILMRRHPQYAFELLSPIKYLQPALDFPYAHHERWDGAGYPRGLKGLQIPQAARLFAVVDVWDALRSTRPYRAAWSAEAASAYLQAQAGSHFDPDAVRLFLELLASEAGGDAGSARKGPRAESG